MNRKIGRIGWIVLAVLACGVALGQEVNPREETRWPGMDHAGKVLLPNGWSLKPAGSHLEIGDFPVNIAVHPSGEYAAVLCAGYGPHEIVIVDLNPQRTRVVSRVQIKQAFYGLTWSPDGGSIAVAITKDAEEPWGVYLVRPDGTGLERVTSGSYAALAWQPLTG